MGAYGSRRMADTDEDSGSRSDYYFDDTSSDSDADPDSYLPLIQRVVSTIRPNPFADLYGSQLYHQRRDLFSRMPKIESLSHTTVLDNSEFSLMTKQACGLTEIKGKAKKNVTSLVLDRGGGMYRKGGFSQPTKCKISNEYLPNYMNVLETSSGKVFCGIFSKDGNCFLTAAQDRYIRLYNSGDGSYKLTKSLRARDVGWSIIDVAFSPNKEQFVYSTWSSSLHLCSIDENSEHQEPLNLTYTGRRFCVFSVVFSSDGRELLGGANDGCLYIYDRERHDRTLKIPAHEYDVNSVVFADDSSHIIYSGGDDGLVKVWDRRTLDEHAVKPVGVLAGHVDGITFIDSRRDGRHLISNCKDQSIKLWDVRVFSGAKAAERSLQAVHEQTWDYRWQGVPKKLYSAKNQLEGDTSIMTYKGHVVLKTLVRCRFSPVESTGQRYIYTGCGTGRVVVYDSLTGNIVRHNRGHKECVRDVSWHPTRNEITTCSWDGMVGVWTYFNNIDQNERDEKAKKVSQKKQPTRRSQRIARQRIRNNTNN